ncbi:D-amino acid aminotransferase [Inmirania thermothiophila]|uniref:D-amino acid aminotransferase n=1 Tax=Inmirania thermothiophila TaxID=1750597 RepID=UPI000F4A5513|nr:D-amino acid aminotransferase [Inmirania thermothiophila]
MTEPPPGRCWLDGRWLPLAQARVSVLDRGFLFGDGVYEVIPVYGGRPLRLEQHLDRLEASLGHIRLANPLPRARWRELLAEAVHEGGGGDLALYLQVTRGPAPRRDHAFPAEPRPTVLVLPSPLADAGALRARGAVVVTLPDIRWRWCHVKAITLLANVLARQQAAELGADEALLVRDGLVSEGSASNVFVVADGVVRTPPKGEHMLPGITRDLVLELLREAGLPCREEPLPAARLAGAEEIWISSSTRELLPVVRLDGRPVGDGRPGPLFARAWALYDAYREAVRRGEAG